MHNYIAYYIKLIRPYLKYAYQYVKFYNLSSKIGKKGLQYASVKGSNETYLFDIRDLVIPSYMFTRHKTYSCDDIGLFFQLVQEKCEGSHGGIFLDIGANIGTTSIYVAKNMPENIEVLAFEPNVLNFKLLSLNCELNDATSVHPCNIALSNITGSMNMEVFDYNRGKCRLISNPISNSDKHCTIETVNVCKLDDYLLDNNIDKSRIKYIWIDVEGHEACAIEGMLSLLSEYKPPLLMEFTPKSVPYMNASTEEFERLYSNLSSIYHNIVTWELVVRKI